MGQKYVLGNEPWYDIMGEPEPRDYLASDCSGLMIGLWKKADVRFGGKTYWGLFNTSRPTAHEIYRKATRITAPEKFGDMFFRLRDGHAYHVGMCIGNGLTLESGDGTGKTAVHTVAWQNARGVVWGRVSHDMGERTTSPTPPGWPQFGRGYVGEVVRELHSVLNQVLKLTVKLPVGNWYGGRTFTWTTAYRVRQFQKAKGLSAHGYVTDSTIAALQRALV